VLDLANFPPLRKRGGAKPSCANRGRCRGRRGGTLGWTRKVTRREDAKYHRTVSSVSARHLRTFLTCFRLRPLRPRRRRSSCLCSDRRKSAAQASTFATTACAFGTSFVALHPAKWAETLRADFEATLRCVSCNTTTMADFRQYSRIYAPPCESLGLRRRAVSERPRGAAEPHRELDASHRVAARRVMQSRHSLTRARQRSKTRKMHIRLPCAWWTNVTRR